ncbi:endonuclease/exonuclease/phosphatase family protein [Quadrisphaera sp. DSM 44207]|uniref:endonuclease/exonuclease/phosphatase family protein n=1 Tax=Quadrisphaera sp. DSM 44207 TaxID=1881057 RepID=UPI0008842E5A|nr:endonuclease/exonuclease/phosphatase family protein [Quadrisphaera sp. DSM 44207]SDQ03996.1 Metal-dependent hydrolase, endonuclease/exonuclease/phosphatase family [Quadrisphaera sp. DSM 44207]
MRLATANVLHGRSPADGRVDLDRYAAALASLDADVLGLQEVDRDQPRSHRADLTALAARACGAVAHRFVPAISGTRGAGWRRATGAEPPGSTAYGIALLSRHPVAAWGEVRLPLLPVSAPRWERRGGRRRLRWVRDEPRVALLARVLAPEGPLTVVVTHLSHVPGWSAWQLRRLARLVAAQEGPLVLMGDLNAAGEGPAHATRLRPLAVADTFPARAPDRQIDHLLGRGVAARGPGRAVHLPISDHRALVADVAVLG